MMKKLEEAKLREEARWREKLFRKKPVWQALAYSHEEDLAMRLLLRKDEERLRTEEHRLRMQHMLSRVNQQPTLFERQSYVNCPKTREELVKQLHKEYKHLKRTPKRSISDLSDIRTLVEMKDEAIQAFLDEHFLNNSDDTATSKESVNSTEEKEKCDCD
ncbi:hypothetical protein NQ317_010711 [Molorchus minor]|uniref:Uncharacterized protein n=1 Tax=Molorchus minor TaxID=1323400 RepID=A0ABQ9K5U4_9CUCU|nr:hypothetical protein NQ317_010711 [Molorchus minor]